MEFNVNNTFFTGKFLLHLPSVDSTNDFAKEYMAKSSPIDGTVILADEQLAGRGQAGNFWLSEANRNLTFSLIYHTAFLRAQEQFYLNMAISLGLQSFVNKQVESGNYKTVIKWPNDILANEKKIAGILIENTISGVQMKYSVIGIGLNVNQTMFPAAINATSLNLLLVKEYDRNKMLNELLSYLEKYFFLLKERKFDLLKKEYLGNLYRFNLEATYIKAGNEFTGIITDVNESGNLIMETKNGIEKFGFKEISFT